MENTVFWHIYRSTAYKYRKYRRKLERSIANHSFQKFSKRKQHQLIRKVERLRNRLRALSLQLKVAASGATLAMALACGQASAQSTLGPFAFNGKDNPLRPPLETGQNSTPVLVDFDQDGDLDLFVGTYASNVLYFQNVGSATQPKYLKPALADDPFENTTFPPTFGYVSPALADLDGDGDFDLVVAERQGLLYYFKNNSGKFAQETGANNPFDGFDLSVAGAAFPKVTFADIDGDGDLDLWAGRDPAYASNMVEIRNNGDGTFAPPSVPAWPSVYSIDVFNPAPAFGDFDGDGDLDLVLGEGNGTLSYYRNQEVETGTIDFVEQTGAWDGTLGNPFDGLGTYNDAAPTLADVDGDGDFDVVVGLQYPTYPSNQFEPVQYYMNHGGSNFTLLKDLKSPFDGVDVGDKAIASFADTDNDGDLDVIMGGDFSYFGTYTTFYSFNDISAPSTPVQFENTTAALGNTPPFGYQNAPLYARPIWADLDLDGDKDLVIADSGSPDRFLYFENQNGTFVEKLATENPFDGIYFGSYYIYAEFADIDNDGDLDAFFSTSSFIYFYEDVGTGSPHVPVYQASTLNGVLTITDFQGNTGYPKLVDVDHDGDLDVVAGTYQKILFFENKGNKTVANFKLDIPNNPFAFMTDPGDNVASLLDADKDGDLDLLVGQANGRFKYFENQNPPPITTPGISEMVYNFGSGPLVVDAAMAVSDPDNDLISKAVVTLLGYQVGDVLAFVPQGGVTGTFDTSTGILTLSGLAAASTYQDVLRSITYDFTGAKPTSSGKKGNAMGKTIVIGKTLQFSVFDADLTRPQTSVIGLDLTVDNAIPSVATSPGTSIFEGTAVAVDGAMTVSDGDDADLSGAMATLSQTNFVPGEDILSFSDQNGISGAYNPTTGTLMLTGVASVANYQAALRSVLYENISNSPTAGNRMVGFMVDDGESLSNLAEKEVSIGTSGKPPSGEIIVRNGISPNQDGFNDAFRIENITTLAPENKVSIYNRWGDKVFEVDNYDNNDPKKRFNGTSDKGKDLPSGVYFYKIEFASGAPEITGYLTLKR